MYDFETVKIINNAINKGQEEVEKLIGLGFDKHYILRSALQDNNALVEYLISCGADINWKDEEGVYTVEYLVSEDDGTSRLSDPEFVEIKDYIKYGFNVNQIWKDNGSIFRMATDWDNLELLKYLIENGTTIHYTEAMEDLVLKDGSDEYNYIQGDYGQILKYLIDIGADTSKDNYKILKEVKRFNLLSAANIIAEKAIEKLQLSQRQQESLNWCVENKYIDIVDLVIEHQDSLALLKYEIIPFVKHEHFNNVIDYLTKKISSNASS